MRSLEYKDGAVICRELTTEEVAAMEKVDREAILRERDRPLTEEEVSRMLLSQQVNALVVDDNTALRMREFYPVWSAGAAYAVGYKVRYLDGLWRVRQAHTSQVGWEPDAAPALWEQICETHEGTLEDPIPYSGSMALTEGQYYHQDYVIYRCIRSTGNPVYHALSELVGLYVEEV
ncbi:MAG: hypothetical protein IJW45_04245 [Oscillospiraceae bacterium]|nr:hypothetical protein [Oscillospiraceae bacterium]